MRTILPGNTITAAATGRLDNVVEGGNGGLRAGWWLAVARIAMLEIWVASRDDGLERAEETTIDDGSITALAAVPRGLFRIHTTLFCLCPHSAVALIFSCGCREHP